MRYTTLVVIMAAASLPRAAAAFDSGSTGEDGVLAPVADVDVVVPADGRLDYTSVTIPSGVTVRFVGDGPVVVLASGDVTIDGVVDVSGRPAGAGAGPFVALGGAPGPGGSWGGSALLGGGLPGLGPGGGGGAFVCAAAGGAGPLGRGQDGPQGCGSEGGEPTTSLYHAFVHGGSGGGGTASDGGGGGGGAIVIAASGTLTVNGAVQADGGDARGRAGSGGGGSVRLVATTLAGAGVVSAMPGGECGSGGLGGCGGLGSVRLEGDTIASALFRATSPRAAVGRPGPAALRAVPRVRIVSIDGVAVEPPTPGAHPQTQTPRPTSAGASLAIIVATEGIAPGAEVVVQASLPTRGQAQRVRAFGYTDGTRAEAMATVTLDLPALSRAATPGRVSLEAWVTEATVR